jgi:hypothetical protein
MMLGPWMPTYVIKEWKVNNQPAVGQPYVYIKGRAPGLLSWLLSMIGIEPTVTFQVTQDSIVCEQGSLAGSMRRVIPLANVSSTINGYRKPIELLILAVVSLVTVILPIIFIILYFLNKSLTIGVIEVSGMPNLIRFKRSVIEGQNIDENAAANVVGIIDYLTRLQNQRPMLPPGT